MKKEKVIYFEGYNPLREDAKYIAIRNSGTPWVYDIYSSKREIPQNEINSNDLLILKQEEARRRFSFEKRELS